MNMTEMRFVKNENVPAKLTIRGNEYQIIYNFKAMASMEAALGMTIPEIMRRFWQGGKQDADGSTVPMLTVREQLTMLQCMMEAAGCEADIEDLLSSLDGRDSTEIGAAIATEILMKSPKVSKSKKKRPTATETASTGTGASTQP